MNRKSILTLLALGHAAVASQAAIISFTDQATFVTQTGAASVGAFPTGAHVSAFTAGEAHFTAATPPTFNFAEWTADLPGADMALNGIESFQITFDNPVHAFGFSMVEVQTDPLLNGTFVDSTFTVSLYNLGSLVDTHTFNAPNDVASFVGLWVNAPFDRVDVTETVGNVENEFFGTFLTSKTQPSTVPDGSSNLLLACGTFGILASARGLRRPRRTPFVNALNA